MRVPVLLAIVALSLCAADAGGSASQKTLRVPIVGAPAELTSEALTATLADGKPARVTRLRTGKDDLLILVVMDVVGELSRIDAARNTFLELAKEMPRTTWIGVMRAQDGLQVVLDPTPDREKLAEAMFSVPVTGKAGLLDTVETALRVADSVGVKSAVRVAVLYITDSDVRNYREDFTNPVINSSDSRDLSRRFPEGLIREKIARLTENVSARQTPLFIVHLLYSSERLNEAYQSGLMRLAAATGGFGVFARSVADLPGVLTDSVNRIRSLGVAWVQLPPKAPKTVQVVLQAEGHSLGYRSQFVVK